MKIYPLLVLAYFLALKVPFLKNFVTRFLLLMNSNLVNTYLNYNWQVCFLFFVLFCDCIVCFVLYCPLLAYMSLASCLSFIMCLVLLIDSFQLVLIFNNILNAYKKRCFSFFSFFLLFFPPPILQVIVELTSFSYSHGFFLHAAIYP